MSIKYIEKEGYEADDIIATYVRQGELSGQNIIILSSDKDLIQKVSESTKFHKTGLKSTEEYGYYCFYKLINADIDRVLKEWEILPSQFAFLQSIMGDKVDGSFYNITEFIFIVNGVKGFGKKKSLEVVKFFGDIEHMEATLTEYPKEKDKKKLSLFQI